MISSKDYRLDWMQGYLHTRIPLFYTGCMVITGKTFHILFAKELIFFFILKKYENFLRKLH